MCVVQLYIIVVFSHFHLLSNKICMIEYNFFVTEPNRNYEWLKKYI